MDSAIQGNTDEEVNGTIKTHEKTQEEVVDLKTDIFEESKTVDIFEESTLSESQDTFVEQINTLQEDIDAGKFPGDIQLGKRSAKHKKLEKESFDVTIYKQKQCRFATSSPMSIHTVNSTTNKTSTLTQSPKFSCAIKLQKIGNTYCQRGKLYKLD